MRTAEETPNKTAEDSTREPSSTTVGLLALLIALALLVGASEALSRQIDESEPPPSPQELVVAVAADYLDAWEMLAYDEMQRLTVPGTEDLQEAHARLLGDLQVSEIRAEVLDVVVQDQEAEARFAATLHVGGLGPWTYRGSMSLVELEDVAEAGTAEDAEATSGWRIAWSPTAVHPALTGGTRLGQSRLWPARAPILAVDGTPLTGADAPVLAVLRSQLVGRVAPAPPERAGELGPPYLEGDVVGVSGLQGAFEAQLAGRPSGQVLLFDAAGQPLRELASIEGTRPVQVQTTIDVAMQQAAEAALGPGRQAALVAVHGPTGEIRAAVSRPSNGFNRALEGRYPPGSTFKVATTYALLSGGLVPDEIVPCPGSTVVNGRRISNAHGEELGPIPFRTAFSRSCNTAFARVTHERLDPASLTAAAEALGFNVEPELPVPAAGGSFPEPQSEVDLVASAIGQARVTASPLHMATMAAAVASGTWHAPRLTAGPSPVARPLDPAAAATIQELMRLVVAEGTGRAARLPGVPVAGKTGTAEFGTRVPPRTHAWFIGFRGDIAFAVLVEDAGFGGEVAAPIAAKFLSRLPG